MKYARFYEFSSFSAPPSIVFVKGAKTNEWNDNTLEGNGFKLSFDEGANSTRVEISSAGLFVILNSSGMCLIHIVESWRFF